MPRHNHDVSLHTTTSGHLDRHKKRAYEIKWRPENWRMASTSGGVEWGRRGQGHSIGYDYDWGRSGEHGGPIKNWPTTLSGGPGLHYRAGSAQPRAPYYVLAYFIFL